jgi:hypothetical protein
LGRLYGQKSYFSGVIKMAEKGRPAHKPTKESQDTAKRLSALGVPHEDIASRLKISADTLVKYYKEELDEGRIDANAAIAGTLFSQAKKGNTAAAIFWLKTRARWKETQVNEVTGQDGGDIKISWADA